jgi:hypothetical protein
MVTQRYLSSTTCCSSSPVGAERIMVNGTHITVCQNIYRRGIAAAEKRHRSGRRSMWHAERFEAGCKTTPSVAISAYGQLASSQSLSLTVGFMFLFQMIQSISLVRFYIRFTIHHSRFYVFMVFECYGTYFYTSQLSAIISPCIYRPLYSWCCAFGDTKLSSSRFSSHQTSR